MPSPTSLEFIPPQLDGRVLAGARRLLPLWLRRAGLRGVRVEGMERLQEAMEAFQGGRCRLLLAFRHPSLDDPAVLAHLLWIDLARAGRPGSEGERRRRFRPRPHAQFLYDRGIPLWAGAPVGWLLSHLGGCSIQRSKLDLPALRTARALLLDGPHPFAVAPEGATNGHNELVSPLEPGVAQLAFWTADDLHKAGRPEEMEVLPVGLQYGFSRPAWPAIEALLSRLEREAGLGALRVRLANGRALRVADLRGAARPVDVAGTRAQVDAALAAAAPHREALLGKGVIIVPVALDEAAGASSSSSAAAAAPTSTPPPPPSRDDLRFIALPVDPAKFAAWFAAQAAAAGADLGRGLYVGLRIDGRVRASGAGVPPFAAFAAQLPPMEWSGFFDGFDGRVL